MSDNKYKSVEFGWVMARHAKTYVAQALILHWKSAQLTGNHIDEATAMLQGVASGELDLIPTEFWTEWHIRRDDVLDVIRTGGYRATWHVVDLSKD